MYQGWNLTDQPVPHMRARYRKIGTQAGPMPSPPLFPITWLATGAVQCSVWWGLVDLGCCGANAIAVEAARWNADTHTRMDTHRHRRTTWITFMNSQTVIHIQIPMRSNVRILENKCKDRNERVCAIHKCKWMIEWIHACLSSHTCLHVHEWVKIVYVCLYVRGCVLVYPEVCVHQEHFISP